MTHIRAATVKDIEMFYGELIVPAEMYVLDADGPVAIAGLVWVDGEVIAVSWVLEAARKYPKQLMRGARMLRAMIQRAGVPVYATRDADEPSADRFLRRVGFEPCGERYVFRHAEPAAQAVPADAGRVRGDARAGAAA